MSTGSCPECGNLVAESARKCPNCGNRDFVLRTDTFADVCKKCKGSGQRFFHVDHTIKHENCLNCAGKGWVYTSFTHDCRDFDEWDHLWNLARNRRREDKHIIRAIKDQQSNPAFEKREGLLRIDAERHADFDYWTETHLKAGFARGEAKNKAWKSFWKAGLVGLGLWLVSIFLYFATHQIVLIIGALLSGFLVLVVSALVLLAKVGAAEWTYGKIHRLYESREFWSK